MRVEIKRERERLKRAAWRNEDEGRCVRKYKQRLTREKKSDDDDDDVRRRLGEAANNQARAIGSRKPRGIAYGRS